MSEQTFVGEETEQPMRTVILPPQPPPHAVLQPDLLAAKHACAVSVVVGVGQAAGDALHPSDCLGATAVFRPVIEFFPDGFPFYGGGFEEALHQSEDAAVTHAPGHQPEQSLMVDGVEVAA